ncbi:proteinral transcription factor ii-i repeat domain-containing protein 2 [Plakobranchus ocellatus]|uniref:Proteinral transcription factor ii-i repeat domain-containing protein 2 n=1 Tax=Plakobranchus ocellatus TaxID=259542 RepID=A0AAV3YQX2_9GAST|nr:proteinral transcription factor ii-i repeat domain-containing protein 2 [Plakobranchus ocellatus]
MVWQPISKKSTPPFIFRAAHATFYIWQRLSGADSLSVRVDDALMDIFHYLENSSKRLKALRKFQEDTGTTLHQILKYGPTRWLSLKACIKRLLEQWAALEDFFKKELEDCPKGNEERLTRAHKFIKDPSSKLYALFLNYALPIFTNANFYCKERILSST